MLRWPVHAAAAPRAETCPQPFLAASRPTAFLASEVGNRQPPTVNSHLHSLPHHLYHPRSLLQDIVAESHDFDVASFVPTLQEYLEVSSPFKRQFLLGWLG